MRKLNLQDSKDPVDLEELTFARSGYDFPETRDGGDPQTSDSTRQLLTFTEHPLAGGTERTTG